MLQIYLAAVELTWTNLEGLDCETFLPVSTQNPRQGDMAPDLAQTSRARTLGTSPRLQPVHKVKQQRPSVGAVLEHGHEPH